MRPTAATAQLPDWEEGSAGVLCLAGPHAIPISTAVRVASDRIVFALGGRREALARLRAEPAAAFCLLARGLAFTAHGQAWVLCEALDSVPSIVAVELVVERVQDHLADGRTEMLSAPAWRWLDEQAADSDPEIRAELRRLGSAG